MRSSLDARRLTALVPEVAVDPTAFESVRAESFPSGGPTPWLDRPDALAAIERELEAGAITEREAQIARDFQRDGYVVLERFFEPDRLQAVWNAYENALATGAVTVPPEPIAPEDVLPGRSLNPHHAVPEIAQVLHDPALVGIVAMLFGARVRPFQTIMGHKGSQQREHSDSIHMTTYPLGYLAGAWIAFEDIHPDSGPLVYYPRSHRLPYLLSRDVGISAEDFAVSGYRTYHDRYEPALAETLAREGLEPRTFDARNGDVLLWHGNIVHAGSPRRDPLRSRKALVCHYFADGCVCYHDLAARLADFGLPR
ncbi:MAG: hypothetical protein NVS4B13_01220 [Candidatus Elarobacter sp.]